MNSTDHGEKLLEKTIESQVNLWNGIMVFSGIVMTFLASETNRSFLLVFLMILYFLMASISIYLIFQVRKAYSNMHNKLSGVEVLTAEQRRKHVEWVKQRYRHIHGMENMLKWVSFSAILLTFVYIIRSNAAILESPLKKFFSF